ncbi:ATPdependent RNA helicase [Nesidiocoris tenuis]|uniref:RNA helicase n=1 Tax=Nesidiocoris tenuis TaxID=355587 RepID=A0ABN7ABE4_9HEMI|nr:ATPdependent RNA helicase [Nesidiocoris tenuis]
MLTIEQQRKNLPIFHVRKRLLMEFEKHQTLIIIGETGCGKTTQIPQYLDELNMEGDGQIAITQVSKLTTHIHFTHYGCDCDRQRAADIVASRATANLIALNK